ncbi:hypothetical protein RHMOL_Rhmol04G0270100 [Rhododendron molle]|uniref:Uncharacterized protein n=1 Tax=Rhododendron molle TaxID=49168 RepID=A0ACC0P5V7_RHOML|nr:hypothetical protein RHMOL_Rhmol04G0270100 [Rhododendron molle]
MRKCRVSYRTNYFIMIIFILGLGFLRRPLAIVAAALTAVTIAFLNDSEPHPLVCFMWTFNSLMGACHWPSWYVTPSLRATILHATLRTPNLKARLNTFREEFRAVWRNYSEL